MEQFWKATALTLLGAILILAVGRQEKDIGLLLTIACCCAVAAVVADYLKPILNLTWELAALADMESEYLGILLRIVCISFVTELCSLLCSDAGSGSLGKMLQLLGSCAVIYMGIPLIRALLAVICDVLGAI